MKKWLQFYIYSLTEPGKLISPCGVRSVIRLDGREHPDHS